MHNISGWRTTTLSNSIESLDAGVSVNAEDRPHRAGEIGILKTSAISGGVFRPEQNKAVLPLERALVAEPVLADSILLSRMNTPALVGECCYIEEARPTLFLPDRIWQLKPKSRADVSMRWLSFVLRSDSTRAYIETHASGTSGSMKNLAKSKLMALRIDYPPFAEQVAIAGILDTLDTTIRQTEAIVEKLKQVKQGLLHDLLTRGIDANGELRPPQNQAPNLYKDSPLGRVPNEWTVELLDSVAVRGSGHTPSKSAASYWNGGIKWVSLADSHRLDQIYITETDKEISELGLANSSAVKHQAGTVILSRDAGVGKSAILAADMAVSQHFIAWLCGQRLNNLYLYFMLQRMKPTFESIAIGSTIKTIGLAFFKKLMIVVPSRDEQDRIVQAILSNEAALQTHSDELAKLRQQKNGLVDDLLTGRIRVTPLLETFEV
jgi:type I restriction enzyme S subunit